jgi:hypothetical protein
MKGKKFDAHEKHFKEKEIKLNREINYIRGRLDEVHNQNIQLTNENKQLKKDNLNIKLKYEKLLEYSKLSDEEIKEALKSDKSLNQLSTLFSMMPKFI